MFTSLWLLIGDLVQKKNFQISPSVPPVFASVYSCVSVIFWPSSPPQSPTSVFHSFCRGRMSLYPTHLLFLSHVSFPAILLASWWHTTSGKTAIKDQTRQTTQRVSNPAWHTTKKAPCDLSVCLHLLPVHDRQYERGSVWQHWSIITRIINTNEFLHNLSFSLSKVHIIVQIYIFKCVATSQGAILSKKSNCPFIRGTLFIY